MKKKYDSLFSLLILIKKINLGNPLVPTQLKSKISGFVQLGPIV